MWRYGIAAALMLLLTVLVVDMVFNGRDLADGGQRTLTTAVDQPPAQAPDRVDPGERPRDRVPPAPAGERTDAAGASIRAGRPADEPVDLPDLERLPAALPSDDQAPAAAAVARPEPPVRSPPALTTDADAQRLQPVKRPDAAAPPVQQIADVQRKLAALGYSPGGADGRWGRRTEVAVREYQKRKSLKVDGRVDEKLIARLDADLRARAPGRRPADVQATVPEASPADRAPRRGVFGTVLGGFQRLLGRKFDSVRHPDEVEVYCRKNADTWIYDFGREAFLFCGNVVAGGTSGRPAAPFSASNGRADATTR